MLHEFMCSISIGSPMTSSDTPFTEPRICVVIGRTRHKMVQAEVQEAARRGAQMIELRLDYLGKAPDFKSLLQKKPCELVATVRRPAEGGRWNGSEESRLMLLRQAIVGGFDWVDLETDIIEKIPRFGSVKRIVSYHNMKEVPKDLEAIHESMCEKDADVVKLAVRAQKPHDVLRVIKLGMNPPKPTVAIAMGDYGAPSRILGAKYGSPFTYAAFNRDRTLAPGLLSFDELRKVFFYSRIRSDTRVYGVIGDPIGHSLSPLVHNRAFKELGINALYLPFRVPRNGLEDHMNAYSEIPISGYSVTIPHKELVLSLARETSISVEEIKAANTLLRRDDGSFEAENTDYSAAVESLIHQMTQRGKSRNEVLPSSQVLVLGAGGVARAIAYALKQEGALVTIANRTHEKAIQLADELNCRSVDWPARHKVSCEILINCTPVGMHPNVDDSPIHNSFLKPDMVVFDTVYIPETTLLVKEARNRGCQVVTGVDFFVRQAAAQFKLFTNQEPPLEVMYKVVKRALSPLQTEEEDD